MDLQLSIGMALNARTRAIFNNEVKPDGIELIPTAVHASELFWRQLRFADFDVSEMSMSSLMMAVANGDDRWVGLPVFTTRRFFHSRMLARTDRGIETPADLKGKKVGVAEYQQTAALWTRGILKHEFGVEPSDMEFFMERNPDHSHGGATGFKPPEGVKLTYIDKDSDIGQMMASGELDATLNYLRENNLVDRSSVDLANHPQVKTIFPDPVAEGIRYYNKTGICPINHGMVVKREIAERHPWVVLNLFKAFEEARRAADARRMEHLEYHIAAGLISPEAMANVRKPMVEHGVVANRMVLETAAQYSHEQGLTPRLMTLKELFAESTLEH